MAMVPTDRGAEVLGRWRALDGEERPEVGLGVDEGGTIRAPHPALL